MSHLRYITYLLDPLKTSHKFESSCQIVKVQSNGFFPPPDGVLCLYIARLRREFRGYSTAMAYTLYFQGVLHTPMSE